MPKHIEIMDTTLRDGEQTSGVSYSPKEKLTIAKLLLDDLKIDRIEVASARVSEGELNSVKEISSWAESNSRINSIEVLTFIDEGKSIQWLLDSGCKVQNLLTKGSLNHLKHQLKKTPDQHFNDISKTIDIAEKNSITTNIYLEDWSNGMKNSKDYVIDYLDFLKTKNLKEIKFSSDDNLQIFCIPPWEIEKLKVNIDHFHNASSFVEMPKNIIKNYCNFIKY